MIKKVILLLIICFHAQNTLASFWGAVAPCLTDPCNCGDTENERYENWNGKRLSRGKKNSLCPPWNKSDGRDDNTCLLKKGFPGAWIGYYENICAEKTVESTYLAPKIRVRGQQCNAFACWTTDNTLDWNGECVLLASGYGLPLHRMCARVASPENSQKSLAQDPGYTKGKHLNFEGATEDDEPLYDDFGKKLFFDAPKLCLYKDPSIFDIKIGFPEDPMDINPLRQPYHRTTEVHPVIKAIQFFVKIASTIAQTPTQSISALFKLMEDEEDDETTVASVLKDLFAFLSDIISLFGDLMIKFLNEVGQINRIVSEEVYGCVNLPLGPFPPPFCKVVSDFFQKAKTQKICYKGLDGNLVSSSSDEECVVSTLSNSFISNSIRVGYDNLIPLCSNGEDPLTTDRCVEIKNLGSFSSAKALHTLTGKRDIIKHCENAKDTEPCVHSKIKHKCSVSNNGCQDGFRVVYGTKIGENMMYKSYFHSDMDNCPSNSGSTCQGIWGINTGEFVDINLKFPTLQSSIDNSPLATSFTLLDKNGDSTTFNASIVRSPTYYKEREFIQDSNQLCVFESSVLMIGCEQRAPDYGLKIYSCEHEKMTGVGCSTSYFEPRFIVSYESEDSSTSAIIEPKSFYNANIFVNRSSINLAGNKFESFVTDDTYKVKPFSGSNAPNPSSLYGTYQDNKSPLNNGKPDPSAIYMHGLEYINGSYHLGGKYACLDSLDQERCPANQKLCVLTKLLNSDIVKCSDFFKKSRKYGGLRMCSKEQTNSCSIEDSIDKIGSSAGSGNINIRNCEDAVRCYDGGIELCTVSTLAEDRIDPSPALGDTLSNSQYYNVEASAGKNSPVGLSQKYDADKHALRNKTPIERGLCIEIPLPSCPEQNDYSEDNGFAYWPSAKVGEISNGKCKNGWESIAPLKRYCVPNPSDKSFSLERLMPNMKCKKKQDIK